MFIGVCHRRGRLLFNDTHRATVLCVVFCVCVCVCVCVKKPLLNGQWLEQYLLGAVLVIPFITFVIVSNGK